MKKQIIAVLAVVAVAGGIARAEVLNVDVVQQGPINIILKGTITGNDGAKVKLQDIPLIWVGTSYTDSETNTSTRAWLVSSATTSNVQDIVGTTTNDVTIVTDVSGTVFVTDFDTGVVIIKGGSGQYADVYYQDSSSEEAGPASAVLYIDAKLKVDNKTGELSLNNGKVSGIWQKAQGIVAGTINPNKAK